jgi:hypothetical protein
MQSLICIYGFPFTLRLDLYLPLLNSIDKTILRYEIIGSHVLSFSSHFKSRLMV